MDGTVGFGIANRGNVGEAVHGAGKGMVSPEAHLETGCQGVPGKGKKSIW